MDEGACNHESSFLAWYGMTIIRTITPDGRRTEVHLGNAGRLVEEKADVDDHSGGVFVNFGLFCFRDDSMTQPHSMAQQIAQTAIAFEKQRLGRKPSSVTVVLGGDTLVITMHGVLSPAEKALAASPAGAAKLQEFHQQLFQLSSDPLRQAIKRITGLEICEDDKNNATAAVQVFSVGTVVQVFLLAGRLPAESWDGT